MCVALRAWATILRSQGKVPKLGKFERRVWISLIEFVQRAAAKSSVRLAGM